MPLFYLWRWQQRRSLPTSESGPGKGKAQGWTCHSGCMGSSSRFFWDGGTRPPGPEWLVVWWRQAAPLKGPFFLSLLSLYIPPPKPLWLQGQVLIGTLPAASAPSQYGRISLTTSLYFILAWPIQSFIPLICILTVVFIFQVGDVTILVNNAAVVHGKSLMDSEDDALLKSQHINTLGQFWVSYFSTTSIIKKILQEQIIFFFFLMGQQVKGGPSLNLFFSFP